MRANASNLAEIKCDFVIATTQASINSNLVNYFGKIRDREGIQYLCFLADENGNPTKTLSLADFMLLSKGVNPFEIPATSEAHPYAEDDHIKTCTEAMFMAGVAIEMGLPQGYIPDPDNPLSIVDFGSGAGKTVFNMYCSYVKVIQNSPPGGFGGHGNWQVWDQSKSKDPWYVSTIVDLIVADIDSELDSPYFHNNPDERRAILSKLKNKSDTAFSLQQLLFDLDNASLESVPTFVDAGSGAQDVLSKCFVNLYSASAKAQGEPLVALTAIAQNADASQLVLTGYEREVCSLTDDNGNPITALTDEQKKVTTLNYLCMTNNRQAPSSAKLDWSWVQPDEVKQKSGMIAISRRSFSDFLSNAILPSVKNSCIAASTSVNAHSEKMQYDFSLSPGQMPDVDSPDAGTILLKLSYSSTSDNSDSYLIKSGEFKLETNYSCSIQILQSSLVVTQELTVYAYVKYELSGQGKNIFDKTITDNYTLSVSEEGSLVLSPPITSTTDNSEDIDRNKFINFFTKIDDLLNDVKDKVSNFASLQINSLPIGSLESFIFPGGKVFTYKAPYFSSNGDLLCDITYVSPS